MSKEMASSMDAFAVMASATPLAILPPNVETCPDAPGSVDAPAPKRRATNKKPKDAPAQSDTHVLDEPVGASVGAPDAPTQLDEQRVPNFIVIKTTSDYIRTQCGKLCVSKCAMPALNAAVAEVMKKACARALANGRQTVKHCDF